MITLAHLIQSHRQKAGLTQIQLAKLAGVGKTVVWDLEHGKESVQWDTLQKIFRVLNITVEWRSPLLARAAVASPPSSATASANSSLSPLSPSSTSSSRSRSPRRTRSS
ncbi:MAG: helix-turn-helix transcriptional regulator [Opitutaceae bacterium]